MSRKYSRASNETRPMGQRKRDEIDQPHKSHNAPVPYPTMHHSEQKCAHFCSEWCIVGYGTGALWDLCWLPKSGSKIDMTEYRWLSTRLWYHSFALSHWYPLTHQTEWYIMWLITIKVLLHETRQAARLARDMLQRDLLRGNSVYMVGSCRTRLLHIIHVSAFFGVGVLQRKLRQLLATACAARQL